ncbi:9457_t:CDS:2, partial [Gigaspora rosea]
VVGVVTCWCHCLFGVIAKVQNSNCSLASFLFVEPTRVGKSKVEVGVKLELDLGNMYGLALDNIVEF